MATRVYEKGPQSLEDAIKEVQKVTSSTAINSHTTLPILSKQYV